MTAHFPLRSRPTLAGLTSLACLLATSPALAQIKPDGEWRGTGGAALSATSGNTTSTNVQLNADVARATASDKITFGAVVNRATNKSNGSSQTTADKWGGTGQYDLNLGSRLFAFGRLALESDKLVDLSLRTAVSAGLGYKIIDTDTDSLEILGGAGYTTDDYSVSRNIAGHADTRFSRASIYLGESSSHRLSPTVALKQRLDLYPALSGDKAVLAKFSAGLSVALNSTLSLNVGLTDSYNSKPPAGTKSNDLGLFTGINLKFGAN